MKVTILGCGSSGGAPLIGNVFGSGVDPNEPRNHRLRPSILIEDGETTLLVDTSPDVRTQLLKCNLKQLAAVLYTHDHADHTHGIDDLRSINWLTEKTLDIYADAETMNEIKRKFAYIFNNKNSSAPYSYKPSLTPHIIEGPMQFGKLTVIPFKQDHGFIKSLGFRIGDFAYSTDVKELDEAAFDILKGIKIWVVDAMRERPHPSHSHLEQTLGWIERVKPERAFLTHLSHEVDYNKWCGMLPPHIRPAHDGLIIET
jgi:phosphoribosyl 1,2-cyclic phosphate phosphodiesterase